MADEPENLILVYLRRTDEKLDRVVGDVGDLKIGVTGVEGRFAGLEVQIAGINRRVDRVETRLDRIERRLDLVELPR